MRRHPECDQLAIALAAAAEELRRKGSVDPNGFGATQRKPKPAAPITPK